MASYIIVRYDEYLAHHGIKGQRWGVRRFQNNDGSLTQEGRERYGSEKDQKKLSKDIQDYWRNRKHYNKLTNWMQERKRKHIDNSPQMKTALADVRDSANKVKESIAIAQKFKDDFVSGKNKEADRYVSTFKKEHPDWAERGFDDASIRDSTFVRYLNDHPSIKQKRSNAYDQYNANKQKHSEACKKAASSFLKDHGNDKVTGFSVWSSNKEFSKRVEDVFATLIESNSLSD